MAATSDGRVLVKEAKFAAEAQLRECGQIGDLEAVLRTRFQRWERGDRFLSEYRVVVRRASAGYETWIEPRHWSCCRPTYGARVTPDE